jgi:hypothetical protein
MENNNVIFRLMKQVFINFLFLSSPVLLLAQATDYNNWDNWEDICFCTMNNSYHPSSIVSADNNLQLLLALKNGRTRKQLDSLKIPCLKSQLLLLVSQHLLRKTDGIYKTVIPILDSGQTAQLRKQSQFVARGIYPEIEKGCRNLVAHLSEQNRSRNAYSIMFSYVLDGLIWDRFKKEGIVKEWDTAGIWSGNYWFLTPKRPVDCGGTNIVSNKKFAFKWNWSYAEKVTDGFWNKNLEMLFPLTQGNTIPDKEIIDRFSALGFFDKDLHLTIPVIDEKENNTLYLLSVNIIDKLLPAFMAKTDIETLKTSYKFSDNSETVVIFYHEVMFDLMDLLLEQQVIQMPTAFKYSEKATLKDAADLCFIVISK